MVHKGSRSSSDPGSSVILSKRDQPRSICVDLVDILKLFGHILSESRISFLEMFTDLALLRTSEGPLKLLEFSGTLFKFFEDLRVL